jgi:ubiquinone/menaquinone biosynthesis C-methylase UbiE
LDALIDLRLETVTSMIAMKNKKKVDAWSSYWSEGNTTSLPNLFAANYDGDVSRFWNEAFTALTENSRVLDICTGNGAIAILASDHVNRRDISCDIHAIDVAKIQASELQNGDTSTNAIKFRSGVAVEETPFPDNYFDLIVGQFALEYCDVAAGIKELSRITREDGRVVLMMHHVHSATVGSTREFIGIADIFLHDPTIFFRLRKYAEQYSGKKYVDTPKSIQKRRHLVSSIDNADSLSRQFPNNRFLRVTLDNIKQLAERVQNDSSLELAEIREFEKIVKYHLVRMQDQRDAALDNEKMAEVEALFRHYGFPSVHHELYYLDSVLFSWTLVARRENRKQS